MNKNCASKSKSQTVQTVNEGIYREREPDDQAAYANFATNYMMFIANVVLI